jgi:succinate-semialdehyde dehydrogenase/glutarate-semialdehyde dehydrogenase
MNNPDLLSVPPHGNPPASPANDANPTATITRDLLAKLTSDVTGSGSFTSRTPGTGQALAVLPEAGPQEVRSAFERARSAQPAWASTPLRKRAAVLLRFHDLLLTRQSEVLDLIQLETGKARLHAYEEVMAVASAARHYGQRARGYLRPKGHQGAMPWLTRVTELRQPRGVVAQIAPWNYPLELSVGDALPAFLAGNAVVMKPDSTTALTALWARQALFEAGLPTGVFQVVLGDGPTIGPHLIENADYVSFTGSTRTGREVATGAAQRLIGASLELGGKNPLLVLQDADTAKAAVGATRACFSSAGQLCVSVERIYVHESVAEEFISKFVARTRGLRLGTALSYGADMGSLVGERQLRTVQRHVEDAVAKGATALTGGAARPEIGPFIYEPTILTGVDESMDVFAEETFGPVVSVYRVTSDDEAVERANATSYGLNASVWTTDARRGHRIAAQLRCGTVNINEGYAAAYGSIRSPMGGMKDSGLGRRHGSEGVLKYTEAQTIAHQRLVPIGPSFGLDDQGFARLMTRSLKAMKTMRLG